MHYYKYYIRYYKMFVFLLLVSYDNRRNNIRNKHITPHQTVYNNLRH